MFKKYNRLQKTKDINHIFKYGKRNVAPHGVFFVFLDKNAKKSRYAVIIGKKFSKTAINRNKMKRIIRSIITSHYKLDNKYDIVVGYTKKNKVLSYKDTKEDIDFLLNKINY